MSVQDPNLVNPRARKCGARRVDTRSDLDHASGYRKADLISQDFIRTPGLKALADNTRPVAAIEVGACAAIRLAGGPAPMFSFAAATGLRAGFAEFGAASEVATALGQGSATLAGAEDRKAASIVRGKTVTRCANVEEDFADKLVGSAGPPPRDPYAVPRRIEDRRRTGAGAAQEPRGQRRAGGVGGAALPCATATGSPGSRTSRMFKPPGS